MSRELQVKNLRGLTGGAIDACRVSAPGQIIGIGSAEFSASKGLSAGSGWVDVMSVSITPIKRDSLIIIEAALPLYCDFSGNSPAGGGGIRVLADDGTELNGSQGDVNGPLSYWFNFSGLGTSSGYGNLFGTYPVIALHRHGGEAAARTYRIQAACRQGGVTFNYQSGGGYAPKATAIALEIG